MHNKENTVEMFIVCRDSSETFEPFTERDIVIEGQPENNTN
jgi:hypothetical protein